MKDADSNPLGLPLIDDEHETARRTFVPGMDLRDWFAGQALVGVAQEYLHRNGFDHQTVGRNLAVHAYRIADAMIAARAAA